MRGKKTTHQDKDDGRTDGRMDDCCCSCWCWLKRPHVSAESQEFNDHLDGEDHGEDHVEDVHDGGEEFGLFVMLTERHSQI